MGANLMKINLLNDKISNRLVLYQQNVMKTTSKMKI